MQISVIIPVYNAAAFLEKAVHSALQQPEVAEVLIIEDASPDNALEIARALAAEFPRVKVFQHPDQQNHGAGASRNVGLQQAQSEYIAFLDADDFYLPDRFRYTQQVFEQHPEAEGVYEAIGVHHYVDRDMSAEARMVNGQLLTTINAGINPKDLFKTFFKGDQGWWSIVGFTMKKSLADRIGYFDESLRQTQDTDFMLRACQLGKLFPGLLDQPVTLRGVHAHNRIANKAEALHFKYQLFQKWFQKMLEHEWPKSLNRYIFRTIISYYPRGNGQSAWIKYPLKLWYAIRLIIRYPKVLIKILQG